MMTRSKSGVSKKVNIALSKKMKLQKVLENKTTDNTMEQQEAASIVQDVHSENNITEQQESYSIELDTKMDLYQMIKKYNKNLVFFKKMLLLKSQMEMEIDRIEKMDKVPITDFETMSFVCPELEYWKRQF